MEHSSHHSPHRSVDHIARLVREGGAAGDPHIEQCELCSEAARFLAMVPLGPEAPPPDPPDGPCPSEDALAQLACGLLDDATALATLRHVTACPDCAARLRAIAEIFGDEDAPAAALRSATPEWRQKMASRMPRPRVQWWKRKEAIAAALVLAVSSGYWYVSRSGPEQLLAEAYTQKRPFEYRLPDKGWSPVTRRMSGGGSFDQAPALIQAQAKIAADPSAPPVAKGRAELLAGEPEAAIRTLEPVREAAALDLAGAYFARGDVSARPEDYATALDLIEQYRKAHDSDRAVWFNRAIVLARLQRYEEAIESWDRYLTLDPSGPWADEARSRREEAVQKKTSVKPR